MRLGYHRYLNSHERITPGLNPRFRHSPPFFWLPLLAALIFIFRVHGLLTLMCYVFNWKIKPVQLAVRHASSSTLLPLVLVDNKKEENNSLE
jgi:hypothetical protein